MLGTKKLELFACPYSPAMPVCRQQAFSGSAVSLPVKRFFLSGVGECMQTSPASWRACQDIHIVIFADSMASANEDCGSRGWSVWIWRYKTANVPLWVSLPGRRGNSREKPVVKAPLPLPIHGRPSLKCSQINTWIFVLTVTQQKREN